MIAGAAQPLRSASFEVLEEAWPVFCLFTVTPWRTAAWDGAWLGLEWTAAESLARALNVAWNAGAVGDLRVMEEAALTVMRARQRR